jgi:hypothetical protein
MPHCPIVVSYAMPGRRGDSSIGREQRDDDGRELERWVEKRTRRPTYTTIAPFMASK